MARQKKHVPVWDFKDGWLYVDGVKQKKYFATFNRIKVWEPKLENIPALEALYCKAYDAYASYRRGDWEVAFESLIAAGGKGHCQPTHKYEGRQGAWWEYTIDDVHPSYGKGKCFGHQWCDRKPKKLLNVELATAFYKANLRSDDLANRYMKVKEIFLLALDRYMKDDFPVLLGDVGRLMWVCINDNKYLMRVEATPKGYCYWSVIKQDDNIPKVML